MFRSSDDGLRHVSVLHCYNPCDALSLFDKSGSAVESAVWHTHLFSAVKDDGNSVAFLVFMHYAADVQPASFALTAS
jgi:hypothetical protein